MGINKDSIAAKKEQSKTKYYEARAVSYLTIILG
jgi:hypothetical protein